MIYMLLSELISVKDSEVMDNKIYTKKVTAHYFLQWYYFLFVNLHNRLAVLSIVNSYMLHNFYILYILDICLFASLP
jgi:hypothetical protein